MTFYEYLPVVLVLVLDIIKHHVEDCGTDETILDCAWEEEGTGPDHESAHDVALASAQLDHSVDERLRGWERAAALRLAVLVRI